MISTYDLFVYAIETFYIPFEDPVCPHDWKEWYHYILFDPDSGTNVLCNICCAGVPEKGYITATLLITTPINDSGILKTYGFCNIFPWRSDNIKTNPLEIKVPGVKFVQQHRLALLQMDQPMTGISLQIEAKPIATPLVVPDSQFLSEEFIGWGLLPGMEVNGKIGLGERNIIIDNKWYCYHDHNYGRFRWGSSIGWLWWVAHLPSAGKLPSATYVFHQGNPHDSESRGAPYLFIYEYHRLKKVFSGNTLDIDVQWSNEKSKTIRLPGVLTPIFADRPIAMPTSIKLHGKDELDEVTLWMTVESNVEIILPDDLEKRYTFLKELNGSVDASHRIDGTTLTASKGRFYAEYAS